jgi:hypothetical protein
VNTDAGIAAALAALSTDRVPLTGPLNMANDGAFGALFNNLNVGNNVSNFSTLFLGTYTTAFSGNHQFSFPTHDDGAAIWVDLNNNGIFEAGAGELALNAPGTAPLTNAAFNIPAAGTYRIAILHEDTGGGSNLVAQFAEPGGAFTALTTIDPSTQGGRWNFSASSPATAAVNIQSGATLVAGSLTGSPIVNLTNGGLQERIYRGVFGANELGNGATPFDTVNPATNASSLLNKAPLTIFNTPGALNLGIVAPIQDRSGSILGNNTDFFGYVVQGKVNVGGPNLAAGNVTFGLDTDDIGTFWLDLNQNGTFEPTEKIITTTNSQGVATRNLPAGTYNFAVFQQETAGGERVGVKFGAGTVATYAALPNFVDPTAGGPGGHLVATRHRSGDAEAEQRGSDHERYRHAERQRRSGLGRTRLWREQHRERCLARGKRRLRRSPRPAIPACSISPGRSRSPRCRTRCSTRARRYRPARSPARAMSPSVAPAPFW